MDPRLSTSRPPIAKRPLAGPTHVEAAVDDRRDENRQMLLDAVKLRSEVLASQSSVAKGVNGGLKVVSEWFPAKERGLAGGLYNIGPSIGSMLAPPLIAWSILNYSWQAAFVIVGLVSMAWVGLWLVFYYPVAKHPALSEAERHHIVSGQEGFLADDGRKPSVLSILTRRNFWGIALPRFLTDPTWGMLSFWVPLYLTTVRGFDLKQIALYAWLPFLAADLGCIFGPAVVLFLHFLESMRHDTPDTVLDGMGFISLLVCSAAVMAFLFFYEPMVRLVEGKKGEAASYCLKTLGIFGAVTAAVLAFGSMQ